MRSAILLLVAITAAACGTADPPVCQSGMPRASQLRADPAFEDLQFYTHLPKSHLRPIPYEVWGNSKFEYTSALEYALAMNANPKSQDDECAYAISLRFSYPGKDPDRRKLRAFSQAVAPAAGIDAATLEKSMADVIASGDKYRERKLELKTGVNVEAGKLFHPTRGEFFMFTVTWPRPVGSAPLEGYGVTK